MKNKEIEIKIGIKIPEGFEFDEFRKPEIGELYITRIGTITNCEKTNEDFSDMDHVFFQGKRIIIKIKRWRAERGNCYFFITSIGPIEQTYDFYNLDDDKRFKIGNYFKELKDAEKYVEDVKNVFKRHLNELENETLWT